MPAEADGAAPQAAEGAGPAVAEGGPPIDTHGECGEPGKAAAYAAVRASSA